MVAVTPLERNEKDPDARLKLLLNMVKAFFYGQAIETAWPAALFFRVKTSGYAGFEMPMTAEL